MVHSVFYKEFLFVSFDRETARTLGFNVTFWNLLLYFTLGLVIAFAMQFAGVMLVFSFLVLPAVTGLLIAQSMRATFAFAVGAALVAAVVGFSLSVPYDLPTGPANHCGVGRVGPRRVADPAPAAALSARLTRRLVLACFGAGLLACVHAPETSAVMTRYPTAAGCATPAGDAGRHLRLCRQPIRAARDRMRLKQGNFSARMAIFRSSASHQSGGDSRSVAPI